MKVGGMWMGGTGLRRWCVESEYLQDLLEVALECLKGAALEAHLLESILLIGLHAAKL